MYLNELDFNISRHNICHHGEKSKILNYFIIYEGRNYSTPSFLDADVMMTSPPSKTRYLSDRHSTDEEELEDDVEDEEDVDVEQCSDTEENKNGNSPPRKKVKQTFSVFNVIFTNKLQIFV